GQAPPRPGLPLPGPPAVRPDRRDHRRQHQRGPPGRRPRDQDPAGHLPGPHERRRGPMMATMEPEARELFGPLLAQDERAAGRLHARLAAAAAAGGLLDVAYRTVDTPLGTLLLAATEEGLVRVAYPSQGHDAALAQLAELVSPRILNAPGRLDGVARQLDEYFAHRRRAAADWDGVAAELDSYGCALLPQLLTPAECARIAGLYDQPGRFRATIDMARHRFGEGQYRYFAAPFPEPVDALRHGLYGRLL